jgi:hypothetical protein
MLVFPLVSQVVVIYLQLLRYINKSDRHVRAIVFSGYINISDIRNRLKLILSRKPPAIVTNLKAYIIV